MLIDEFDQVLPHRLELHYVPKHINWLNIVDIEIGVLRSRTTNRN